MGHILPLSCAERYPALASEIVKAAQHDDLCIYSEAGFKTCKPTDIDRICTLVAESWPEEDGKAFLMARMHGWLTMRKT